MKAILSADSSWGIGYRGGLLARVPEDMRFFRQTTTGGVVVMGRETLESFPNQEPLKDRVNIVLTRRADYFKENLIVCRSLGELTELLKYYDVSRVFVIGGESVYRQLLPDCEEAVVTRFRRSFTADRFFPNLDREPGWKLIHSEEPQIYNGLEYVRDTYRNLLLGGAR